MMQPFMTLKDLCYFFALKSCKSVYDKFLQDRALTRKSNLKFIQVLNRTMSEQQERSLSHVGTIRKRSFRIRLFPWRCWLVDPLRFRKYRFIEHHARSMFYIRSHDGSKSEGSFRNVQTCGKVCSEFKILSIRCLAALSVTQLFINCLTWYSSLPSYLSLFRSKFTFFSKIIRNGHALFTLRTEGELWGQEIGFEQKHSDYNAKILFIYSRHTVVILETMSHFDNYFDSGKLYFRK